MATRSHRTRRPPAAQRPKRLDHPHAARATLAAAWRIYNSPVILAARLTSLGHKVVLLAWTGHTSLLFGTVHLAQPYPLEALRHHRAHARVIAPVHLHGTALLRGIPAKPAA